MKASSRRLYRRTVVPAPLDEVFAFFSQAGNLDLITPPWLHFRILTPTPLELHRGARIDFALKLNRLRFRWTTEITAWNPPHSFEDTQIKGPYREWVHFHGFAAREGTTVMEDAVFYRVPGGILEPLIHFWMVRPKLDAIFDYRTERIQDIFRTSSESRA